MCVSFCEGGCDLLQVGAQPQQPDPGRVLAHVHEHGVE
eukprot:COSAG02_NODE_66190_length_256_cov_0.649682_1_plen_37_part_10